MLSVTDPLDNISCNLLFGCDIMELTELISYFLELHNINEIISCNLNMVRIIYQCSKVSEQLLSVSVSKYLSLPLGPIFDVRYLILILIYTVAWYMGQCSFTL